MVYPKDLVVLVGLYSGNKLIPNKTLYYRFLVNKNGELKETKIFKTRINTADAFESILTYFFVNKKLISESYDIRKISPNSVEYFGIKLENSKGEKLNIYYSSKALSFAEDIGYLTAPIKYRDFYEYSKKHIDKGIVNRMTIRPGSEKSQILYVFDNGESSYLQKRRELGIYYRESQGNIDRIDLSLILSLIRYFINAHLGVSLYYKYEGYKLFIGVVNGPYIGMKNENLIDAIEKSRILDDLWLLMHGLIKEMPSQEESIENKEMLRELNRNYRANHLK